MKTLLYPVMDEDVTYLFNISRHHPYAMQKSIVVDNLDFLDSVPASTQYSAADIIYMRKCWVEIDKLVDEHYRPHST